MQDNNSSQQQKPQGSAVNTTAAKIAQQKVQGKVASAVGKRFAQTKLASSVAGKAIGKAVGAIAGGPVGTAIAVASMVNIKKLPEYAAGAVVGLGSAVGGLAGAAGAVVGAAVAGVGITIGIAIITIPILVGLIMFIINSGAYIVPPSSVGQPIAIDFGTLDVGASCPIPGGRVLWGSYGSPYGSVGHGTNQYWDQTATSCTAYSIPEATNCFSRQAGDYCYNPARSCTYYGYAADFIYPNQQVPGQPIYLPYINGESVYWTATAARPAGGGGGILRATQSGKAYEMLFLHLQENPVSGQSGSVTGVLRNYRTPHVHVELKIDGVYVPPDFMCAGGGPGGGTTPVNPPPESQLPVCGTIGGTCISTPNCSRENRYTLPGRCTSGDPSYLCCSSTEIPTEDLSCTSQGGQCWNPTALGLLNPTGPLRPKTCEEGRMTTVPGGVCGDDYLCCK